MKKLLALTIALTACMVSCGDDDGKGNTTINNYYYNTSAAPSKDNASKLVSNVASVAAQKAPDAAPGTKAWCDAVAETIQAAAADGLILAGAEYDDENLSRQIALLDQNISKCEDDSSVTSFDWYTDAKKQAAASCTVPAGMDMKGFWKDAVAKLMAFDGDCDQLGRDILAVEKKYAKEYAYVDMLQSSCDEGENDCAGLNCTIDWEYEVLEDTDAFESKLALVATACGEKDFMDPCAGITCSADSFCFDGQCIDMCTGLDCGDNATCSKGFCVPNEPVSKSCTEDPSICGANQHCDAGRCVPNSTQNDCASYTQAISAFDAAVAAYSGDDCEALDVATYSAVAATGVSEDIMDACVEDWMDLLSSASKAKMEDICTSNLDVNCNNYPTLKSTMISFLKSIDSCDDVTQDALMSVIAAAAADGLGSAAEATMVAYGCAEAWAMSLSAAEQQEIAEKVDMLQDCSVVPYEDDEDF